MLKNLIVYSVVLMFAACNGQKATSADGQKFNGTIIEKPWSKSTQSYCAQGSEYYILQTSDGVEYVLQNSEEFDFSSYNGLEVSVEAALVEKVIEKPENTEQQMVEQRPVSGLPGEEEADFTCTVMEVYKIELIK